MSIGVSVGLCSAMGLLFGTAHMTLPFLLLGRNILHGTKEKLNIFEGMQLNTVALEVPHCKDQRLCSAMELLFGTAHMTLLFLLLGRNILHGKRLNIFESK